MNKQNVITWILLLLLTVIAGHISNAHLSYVIPLILLLAILKFIGVAFNFMELKKANVLWGVLILGFLVVFGGLILLIKA